MEHVTCNWVESELYNIQHCPKQLRTFIPSSYVVMGGPGSPSKRKTRAATIEEGAMEGDDDSMLGLSEPTK